MIGFLILLLTVLLLFYLVQKRKHSYWARRGVAQIEPKFLFGDFKDVTQGKRIHSEVIADAYRKFKKDGVEHGGIYMAYSPVWIPVDLKLIKRLLYDDYWYFSAHGYYYQHKNDVLTNQLFNAKGKEWKALRRKLTPTFTSGKLKLMFDIFDDIGNRLEKKIGDLYLHDEPLNIKEVAACFATDAIASFAFGLECNTLKDPNNKFRETSKNMFKINFFLWELLEMLVNWDVLNFFGYSWLSKDTNQFFIQLVSDMIEYREKNSIIRYDYLHLLLELRKKDNEKGDNSFTIDDITANVFVMYTAGFDTVSSTMSFLLYELAIHQDVQDKARKEIVKVLSKSPDGRLTYDSLHELKYCNTVIQETLRRHAVVPEVLRHCTADYKVPGTNIVIQKGTDVFIPTWGVQNDPEYFPNPEQFNPENFSEENKATRPEPTFLAFGDGHRQCLGIRFAYIQLKLAMVKYLTNYKYSLNEKVAKEIKYFPNPITLEPKGEILLNISKI